jgi:hypothetical protein
MLVRRLLFVYVFFGLSLSAASSGASDPTSVYAALRGARPKGTAIAVKDFAITRDAFRLRFQSGSFQFLDPVEGRIPGAVFVGDGSFEIDPASVAERRHLAFVSGEKDLAIYSDRFQNLVLLFTDGTGEEITRGGSPVETAVPNAAGIYDAFLKRQRRELRANFQLRMLGDFLRPPDPKGFFLAYLDGQIGPGAVVLQDPAGLNWFSTNFLLGDEESAFYVVDEQKAGFWYLAHERTESGAVPHPPRRIADAEHYVVETDIQRNTEIRGTTTIRFQALAAGLTVVPVSLLGKLRVKEAAVAPATGESWMPATFVQEKEDEDSDAAIILPAPMGRGATVRLRIAYEGKDVLHAVGDGNFVVGARESWYPNLGVFVDLATFDLTYRVPKINQAVSVGKLIDDKIAGDVRTSVWKADKPIRVAGFNYGTFKKLEVTDKGSGVHVEVYTNPGTPDIVKEINAALQTGRQTGGPGNPVPDGLDTPFTVVDPSDFAGLHSVTVDVDTLAKSALADGVNTARVASTYFGPLAQDHVSITQQAQWAFGQSWPSLVFLPYLAFLDGTTRRELGLGDTASFVEQVGPHEFAHQWWGHQVGWASYRDQWLSEGLAEFTSSLVLQATGGMKKFQDYWEAARRWILQKPRSAQISNDAAGPITQGFRLRTWRNPFAYDAIVYAKSAYVIHMLRMLLRDHASSTPDARFMALMKDFASSYAGKNPSTRDFQSVVERHMTPELNAAANGKMDYFFRQWVHGTEIPRYRAKLELRNVSGDQYRLSGSIGQEGVSDDFRTVLPVWVEYGKGELSRFGMVPLVGNQTIPVDVVLRVPKKPRRAVVNALHEVLARD